MPNKRRLPTHARRIPEGTTRADYEPEVVAEYDRNRWRRNKRNQRKRQRHKGFRDVNFFLGQEAREALTLLRKEAGMSGSKYITHLLMEKLQCYANSLQKPDSSSTESGS